MPLKEIAHKVENDEDEIIDLVEMIVEMNMSE